MTAAMKLKDACSLQGKIWQTYVICTIIDAESLVSLYTSTKSDLRDRVLGEVEKDSFIALPGKGGHSRLMLSNVPTWRR